MAKYVVKCSTPDMMKHTAISMALSVIMRLCTCVNITIVQIRTVQIPIIVSGEGSQISIR